MAEKSQPMQPRQRTIKTQYKEAGDFRSNHADGVVVVTKADDIGALVQVTFTSNFSSVVSDKTRVEEIGNGIRPISPPEFELDTYRMAECAVSMRPDHAMGLASAIMQQLSQMPEHLRRLYRIPDIAAAVSSLPDDFMK
ncbi:hypothetical protein [Methylobacterium sp. A52T]